MADSILLPRVKQESAIAATEKSSASLWERLGGFVSEHKKEILYTGTAIAVLATGAAIYYRNQPARARKSSSAAGKGTRERKHKAKPGSAASEKADGTAKGIKPGQTNVADGGQVSGKKQKGQDAIPAVDENSVKSLSEETRKAYAAKFKSAGNTAYANKDFKQAIILYSKAILCEPNPVFYSNRAACYVALQDLKQVIADTTVALEMNPGYVKALNRRAVAYEMLKQNSEALLDYTACCIMDNFANDESTKAVERMLKKVAESKASEILRTRPKKFPSAMFVNSYLEAFRSKPVPKISNTAPGSGDEYLAQAFAAIEKKEYQVASDAFDKAVELGCSHKALALNYRGTFNFIRGDTDEALKDFDESIKLDKTYTQTYVKRASAHMEKGNKAAAWADFKEALAHDPNDPDIYYHRGQVNFITNDFAEAAKDYQKSAELDSSFVYSHVQLGVAQYKMGATAQSMATFRRCIKKFDKTPEVYNYYGELLLDQQRYQDAIEKFDTAFQLEQLSNNKVRNILPLINKALAVFQAEKDTAAAEKLCKKALEIDPECDVAVATIAQLLLQEGRTAEALEYFDMSVKLARTEGELVNALSYAEATRTQLDLVVRFPHLAQRVMGLQGGAMPVS